jgi:undecaprenyl-diphosphatase
MTIIQAIILGIVQGITEFLPISSSAHLVLVPYWLNWELSADQAFVFDVLVQMGTLVAVIIYFAKDIWSIIKGFIAGIIAKKPFQGAEHRIGWLVILATIPAGIAGLLLKDKIEAAFANPYLVAVFLLVTAVLITLAEWIGKKVRNLDEMNPLDAVVIGLFQALSIFPGISRSGSTISGGMFRNITREASARFSFIISIPVMMAAGLMGVLDLLQLPNLVQFLPTMIIGFVVSGVVGYFAIAWLMKFITKRPLIYFSIYCILVAIVTFVIHHVR